MLGSGAPAMTKPAVGLGLETGKAPGASAGGGHSHGGGCTCCETDKAMVQNVSEVGFEKGIWGKIIRGASAEQIETFIRERGKKFADLADESGYTPLLYSARQGDAKVCEVLLRHGANPNAKTPGFASTCQHRTAMMGHEEATMLLLQHGAVATLDGHGKRPSDLATEKGHVALASKLKVIESSLPAQ